MLDILSPPVFWRFGLNSVSIFIISSATPNSCHCFSMSASGGTSEPLSLNSALDISLATELVHLTTFNAFAQFIEPNFFNKLVAKRQHIVKNVLFKNWYFFSPEVSSNFFPPQITVVPRAARRGRTSSVTSS
jgi:hypothetical protein